MSDIGATTTASVFGPDYYRTGNYADYAERAARYHRTADEIARLYAQIGIVNSSFGGRVLDFGCGFGFLADGLRRAGLKHVLAYDPSATARDRAKQLLGDNLVFESQPEAEHLIALDVFEHMEDAEIVPAISRSRLRSVLVRIPCAEDGRGFHLAISRRDPTHINCKDRLAWTDLFRSCGFPVILRLAMYQIYDAPGVFCGLALRS